MTQGDERPATLSDLVAEEIRAVMARKRMTGRSLAQALGVSPAWVSYRLTGTQRINLNDLERIADALGVPIISLLPKDELPKDPPRPARAFDHRPDPRPPRPTPRPRPTKAIRCAA